MDNEIKTPSLSPELSKDSITILHPRKLSKKKEEEKGKDKDKKEQNEKEKDSPEEEKGKEESALSPPEGEKEITLVNADTNTDEKTALVNADTNTENNGPGGKGDGRKQSAKNPLFQFKKSCFDYLDYFPTIPTEKITQNDFDRAWKKFSRMYLFVKVFGLIFTCVSIFLCSLSNCSAWKDEMCFIILGISLFFNTMIITLILAKRNYIGHSINCRIAIYIYCTIDMTLYSALAFTEIMYGTYDIYHAKRELRSMNYNKTGDLDHLYKAYSRCNDTQANIKIFNALICMISVAINLLVNFYNHRHIVWEDTFKRVKVIWDYQIQEMNEAKKKSESGSNNEKKKKKKKKLLKKRKKPAAETEKEKNVYRIDSMNLSLS